MSELSDDACLRAGACLLLAATRFGAVVLAVHTLPSQLLYCTVYSCAVLANMDGFDVKQQDEGGGTVFPDKIQ
jgi:hypothetical protein